MPPTRVASTSHAVGQAPGGDDHRRHGRDEQQLDDAGLGERQVGARPRTAGGTATLLLIGPPGRRAATWRTGPEQGGEVHPAEPTAPRAGWSQAGVTRLRGRPPPRCRTIAGDGSAAGRCPHGSRPRPTARLAGDHGGRLVALVVAGAAVRLTGSGLGLPEVADLLGRPRRGARSPPPGDRVRQPGVHRGRCRWRWRRSRSAPSCAAPDAATCAGSGSARSAASLAEIVLGGVMVRHRLEPGLRDGPLPAVDGDRARRRRPGTTGPALPDGAPRRPAVGPRPGPGRPADRRHGGRHAGRRDGRHRRRGPTAAPTPPTGGSPGGSSTCTGSPRSTARWPCSRSPWSQPPGGSCAPRQRPAEARRRLQQLVEALAVQVADRLHPVLQRCAGACWWRSTSWAR